MDQIKPYRLTFTIISLIPFSIYLYLCNPGIGFTDSGELAASCYFLGVSHPTGYPLLHCLAHAAGYSCFPGRYIFRLNLINVTLAAVSNYVFLILIRRILIDLKTRNYSAAAFESKHRRNSRTGFLSAIICSNVYAYSHIIMSAAIEWEVHALQSLLLLCFLLAIIRSSDPLLPDQLFLRYFFLSAFLLGLLGSNHLSASVLFAGFLFWFLKQRRHIEPFHASAGILFILLGLALYLYLPIRAARTPMINWGSVETITAFQDHLTGKQFQFLMFTSFSSFSANLKNFFSSLPTRNGILVLLAPWGYFLLRKHHPDFGHFIVFILLLNLLLVSNYGIFDLDPYYLSAVVMLAILTSTAVIHLCRRSVLPAQIAACAMLPLSLLPLYNNLVELSYHRFSFSEQYTSRIADLIEPGGLVISRQWSYFTSPFIYKQTVENYRPDIVVVDREILAQSWSYQQMERWYPATMKLLKDTFDVYSDTLEKAEISHYSNFTELKTAFETLMHQLYVHHGGPKYGTYDILEFPGSVKGFRISVLPLLIEFNSEKPVQIFKPAGFIPEQFPESSGGLLIENLSGMYRQSFRNYAGFLDAHGWHELADEWESIDR